VNFDLGTQPVIKPAHEIVTTVWGVRNIAPNVSGVLFRNPGKLAILEDPEWLRLRMCGDWAFYLSIIRGGLVGYSPLVTNFYRQHPDNISIGTHDKDLYYQEHETTARYLVKLYNVGDENVRRNEDVLYRHWLMKRGSDHRAQFESLFDVNQILRETGNRKPNIAIAVYALVPGGGEIFPIMVANLLFARGFGVTVLNFERERTNSEIRKLLHSAIPIIEPENSADAGELLAKLGVELVHSHHSWTDVTLAIALKAYPHIHHVVTMHGLYELLQPNDLRLYETDLERVDAFVYIAEKNLDPFSNQFRRRTTFTKITNTAALSPLSGLSRRELGINESDFVLCLASRAVPEKGWEEAVQAVTFANGRSRRPIRLLLVGNGPEFDRLSKLRLPPFVHLLGFRANVRDFFAIADAGLIASRFKGESCPLVLIECLSVGKPVISTDIGEVKNMLMGDHGLAGVVHPLNNWTIDVSALSDTILNLASNSQEYTRICKLVPTAIAKFDRDKMIDRYISVYKSVLRGRRGRPEGSFDVSVVLVVYNMARELRRTIKTLSPQYQQLSASEYEIIVIDNGSNHEYNLDELRDICPNLRFLRMDNPNPSPVEALNLGISLASGSVICASIDAARMASPNLLKVGTSACALHPRAVVGSLSYHLGYEAQNQSVHAGYNQVAEDALLQTVDWETNGYELFNIASFDPSSRFGFYELPAESNALFMRRELWTECGGFDAAFRSIGGGLCNLDLWSRLCEDDRNVLVILLGEGTFHQFHGGVATNAKVDPWVTFHKEYVDIRGVEFRFPSRKPFLFGRTNQWMVEFERRLSSSKSADECRALESA
jgi:glycosyltransferase involved in cell wall biosynthesis